MGMANAENVETRAKNIALYIHVKIGSDRRFRVEGRRGAHALGKR